MMSFDNLLSHMLVVHHPRTFWKFFICPPITGHYDSFYSPCYTDMDECSAEVHKCNPEVSNCVDTKDSYRCDCVEGYISVSSVECQEGKNKPM